MPRLRQMTPEEVKALNKEPKGTSARSQIEEAYDALLMGYDAGDMVIAELDDGENKTNTRNRIRAAARRRHMEVEFLKTKDERTVKFRLRAEDRDLAAEAEAALVAEDVPF